MASRAAAGAMPSEAQIVAKALVEANLEGHDSHGIVRVPEYVGWMEQNLIHVGAHDHLSSAEVGVAVRAGVTGDRALLDGEPGRPDLGGQRVPEAGG